jgi:type 1 glutamine amidotransferase
VLLVVGGSSHAHDFHAIGDALAALLTDHCWTVIRSDHPDSAAVRLSDKSDEIDVVVVHGLWWRMEGEAYDRWRDDHGYVTSERWREAMTRYVDGGGGLVALHTAPICFDDWPEWGDIVGGAWQWGVSSHPPLGPVSVAVVPGHAVVEGLPDLLRLNDEIYGDLDVRDDVDVFLIARRHHGDRLQPVGWAHRFGRGLVVYDGLGHDAASLTVPDHRRLIVQALEWVTATPGSTQQTPHH